MRTATTILAVLGPAALIGAGLFALWREPARQPSLRGSPSDALEPGASASQEPARAPTESPSTVPAASSPSPPVPVEDGPARVTVPQASHENALVFRVADARTGAALTTFEVRVGQAHLRPLLDDEGRTRHDFPGGLVRFPGLIEGNAGESVQLAITARGYAELRVPEIFVAPGSELDLGTLRLERVPRVTVRVLDELTGEPVSGARVSLLAVGSVPESDERPPLSSALDPWRARTDRDGRVLLSSRPGEQVTLSVRHAGHERFDARLFLPLSEEHQETVRLRPVE